MKQYDIEYYELESGAIRLKQDAYGCDAAVDLHPMQLRAIAEHFGLVTPQLRNFDCVDRPFSSHLTTKYHRCDQQLFGCIRPQALLAGSTYGAAIP